MPGLGAIGGQRHWYRLTAALCVAIPSTAVLAAAVADRSQAALPPCGQIEARPHGAAAPRRTCPKTEARSYRPRHQGLGYDVLALETEACFVPDSAYALLDDIVDKAIARLSPTERSGVGLAAEARGLAVSRATNAVLIEMGFGLYIPTATLGDALVSRAGPGEQDRYIVDCDTGAMILMTVADVLDMPAALVEITLPGGDQHDYVRWTLADGRFVDWDTNQRGICRTPDGQPDFQARALTRTEAMGYAHTLRAALWKRKGDYDRAVQDYRTAMRDRPDSPIAYNGFAWIVATTDWPARDALRADALQAAERAVSLQRSSGDTRLTRSGISDYMDTLACLYAGAGDFNKAIAAEQGALAVSHRAEFRTRLASFSGANPKDCTGAR